MIDVVRTRIIAAESDAVWAVLADFAAISTWATRIDHSSITHEADGAPTNQVGLTRRIQMGRNTLLERVVTWTPPRTLAYEIRGLPKIIKSVQNRWDLTAAGTVTTATLTSTIDTGPRPPQQIIARLVGKRLAKESDALLSGIAVYVERLNRG